MLKVMKPTTPDILTIILWPQRVQCCLLNKNGTTFTLQHAQTYDFKTVITFAQPTLLEDTIRTLLKEQNIPHAFVSLALAPELANEFAVHQHILQCQLLAINTPFHCAGITTHQKAADYAHERGCTLNTQQSTILYDDLMCHMGLYVMAHSPSKG